MTRRTQIWAIQENQVISPASNAQDAGLATPASRLVGHRSQDSGSATPSSPLRLGVLLSGSGRTLQNFLDEIAAGRLPAEVAIVISSRPCAGGLERAAAAGIPAVIIDRAIYTSPTVALSDRASGRASLASYVSQSPHSPVLDLFSEAITVALKDARVDLVCMAGFSSFWQIPPEFEHCVMNIHPALLPEFGGPGMFGRRVHAAVLASGRTESGCTVHFADNTYDHGPIILQRRVPVRPGDTPDTLAGRVFKDELIAYPDAIRLFAARRLTIGPHGEVVIAPPIA